MITIKEGHLSQAICHTCKKMSVVKFVKRDIPLSDNSQIIRGILAGVCQDCDSAIVIPMQSSLSIQEQIDAHKKQKNIMDNKKTH